MLFNKKYFYYYFRFSQFLTDNFIANDYVNMINSHVTKNIFNILSSLCKIRKLNFGMLRAIFPLTFTPKLSAPIKLSVTNPSIDLSHAHCEIFVRT